jgi:RNA polymerase sigma factor (TIGR02999 family)
MTDGDSEDHAPVTELLLAWGSGDEAARDRLLPLVYADLRRRAGAYLRRERGDHTLGATGLVHEAYLRLVDQKQVSWQNRSQFYGIASQLMRRVLVDHARKDRAQKRGGEAVRVELCPDIVATSGRDVDLVALDRALDELAQLDERQSRVVELRYFGGLSVDETAAVLDISPATVKREWTMARAWIYERLRS